MTAIAPPEPQYAGPNPAEISFKVLGRLPVTLEDRTISVGAVSHTYRTTTMPRQFFNEMRSEKAALAFRKRFLYSA